MSVDLRNVNGVVGSYGIAFGIAENWYTFYTLEIYPDGRYGIYRFDPNNVVVPLSEAYSSAIYQGNATNHLKVVRQDGSIDAYANGQLLASVMDGTYYGSKFFGLVVFPYSQPNVDICFDNFTVYPVHCGGLNSRMNIVSGRLQSSGQQHLNFNSIKEFQSRPQRESIR